MADQEIEAEGEEERERDKGSEEEPEDRQEGEEGAEDEEVESNSEGEIDEEELKEVFAAGWKAKQKTSEVRKSRGWRPAAKSGGQDQSTDARKRVTTCSSCGLVGHWKGDAECPNVKSGQDPPHTRTPMEFASPSWWDLAAVKFQFHLLVLALHAAGQ